MNIRVYLKTQLVFTLLHTHERMPEYILIEKLIETNARIYLYRKINTNECPNTYSRPIYLNIQIYL